MSDADPTHYEVRASRISPRRTRVDTGDGTFVIGTEGNPVEHLLGAVLACLNSTGAVVARDMDIDIESLEATVEGDLNYATYRGEDVEDRAGLQGVAVTLSVETAADADLDAWLAAVKARCPATDNLENETDLEVTVE